MTCSAVNSPDASRAPRPGGDPRRRLRPRPSLSRPREPRRPARAPRSRQVCGAVSGVSGARRIDRLALFRRLEFLAPDKSIEVFLDRSASFFARDEPTSLTASISWRTPEGERQTSTVYHDLEIYRDLGYIEFRSVVAIQRDNPYPNHNFEVEIVGIGDTIGFSEVDLPAGEIEVIEYREGNELTTVRKLPGLVKYSNVTLKQGITGHLELFNWWKSVRDGQIARERLDQAARRAASGSDALVAPERLARQARGRPAARAGERGRDRDARARARGFDIEYAGAGTARAPLH